MLKKYIFTIVSNIDFLKAKCNSLTDKNSKKFQLQTRKNTLTQDK